MPNDIYGKLGRDVGLFVNPYAQVGKDAGQYAKRKLSPKLDTPAIGFVTFASDDGRFTVTTLLGDGPATPTGGYGGWTVTARARRRGFTIWTGNEPLQIDIPIMIDHWAEGDEVKGGEKGEYEIRQLERMAGLSKGMTEPPLVIFNAGGAIPHDVIDDPSRDWVIADIAWGDCERTVYGNRYRQAAVVSVMQYVENDELDNQSAVQRKQGKKKRGAHGKAKKGANHKRYTVKKGDTLRKIAAKKLGNAKRWHEIADLNSIRDGSKLVVGQSLRLP